MYSYMNGNYEVTLLVDGTKIRRYSDIPLPIYPESLDLKITNYCDTNCTWCHEKSNIEGKHGDLLKAYELLKDLPVGSEIAIGGGNPLSHPGLIYFLVNLKKHNIISNITINQTHLRNHKTLIKFLIEEKLVHGIGISYHNKDLSEIKNLIEISDNIVIHLIAGINTIETLIELYQLYTINHKVLKVLILGYKQYGLGESYYNKITRIIDDKIKRWYQYLHEFFQLPNLVISFDNLAIKQLNIKRFFSKENWEKFYMGDDGQYTMYIDAVKQEYCTSSTTKERFPIKNKNITEIFSHIRKL